MQNGGETRKMVTVYTEQSIIDHQKHNKLATLNHNQQRTVT